jgi:hypothetical protein
MILLGAPAIAFATENYAENGISSLKTLVTYLLSMQMFEMEFLAERTKESIEIVVLFDWKGSSASS